MELTIAQLRKLKGVSQQQLAEYLGVTYQAVSKWETKAALPDITLLPQIAKFFEVSVDEVLGLCPIRNTPYIPRNTDDRTLWRNRGNIIKNDRMIFWNEDYLNFLIKEVWKITKPIDIIEFCCCDGDLGARLLNILPEGSTYTGVDSEYLVHLAEENFTKKGLQGEFIASDIYSFDTQRRYDLSICQAALRHCNHPVQILEHMKNVVKHNGLVISIEINREIENVGIYANGIDYDYMCTAFDWRRLWMKELENEGRDYAIGFRVPFYMKQIGLRDVDSRMNDKVTLITPKMKEFEKYRDALAICRGWTKNDGVDSSADRKSSKDFMMSRGYKRTEVENLEQFQKKMSEYMESEDENFGILQLFGFIISYGRK